MLTNRCEKKLVVLLINQKDYELYNQQTSTNEIRFTLHQDQRTKWVNYAKQTQFPEYPNKRKHCINKGLWKCSASQPPSKQSQFKANSKPIKPNSNPNMPKTNPIQTQFKANSNPIKPNFKPPTPKTNPIKPNFKPTSQSDFNPIINYQQSIINDFPRHPADCGLTFNFLF